MSRLGVEMLGLSRFMVRVWGSSFKGISRKLATKGSFSSLEFPGNSVSGLGLAVRGWFGMLILVL